MIVLGIDPGTIIMGYGVIESQDGNISLIKYGALNTPSRSPIGERLSFLYRKLMEIIIKYQPWRSCSGATLFRQKCQNGFCHR